MYIIILSIAIILLDIYVFHLSKKIRKMEEYALACNKIIKEYSNSYDTMIKTNNKILNNNTDVIANIKKQNEIALDLNNSVNNIIKYNTELININKKLNKILDDHFK